MPAQSDLRFTFTAGLDEFLLVDGMAPCAVNHPLSVPSLTRSLGTAAVTRAPIRDARRLRLKDSCDLISLSVHRVLLHPDLPQHPEIQQFIAQARKGAIDLHEHFMTCSDTFWKRIVSELPRAEDYS